MKKITIAILMLLGTFSMASAELGVNVGVSGQFGYFEATGHENESGEISEEGNAAAVVGYASFFIEKKLGSLPVSIGIDYVPSALESETAQELRLDRVSDSSDDAVTQKIQVDFEDLTTFYIAVNINENLYVKAGVVDVDVITNESLGTGAVYGNTSLDGSVFGAGYHKSFDSGLFVRAEANVMEFDGTKLTSSVTGESGVVTKSANIITLDDLNGASAKFSIGKTF
jgi:hypothetical protein